MRSGTCGTWPRSHYIVGRHYEWMSPPPFLVDDRNGSSQTTQPTERTLIYQRWHHYIHVTSYLSLLLSPLQAVTIGQRASTRLPQPPSHLSFPALPSASSGGQRLTIRGCRPPPAWEHCTTEVGSLPAPQTRALLARAGLGTPELGLTRTSQGDVELIREAPGDGRGATQRRELEAECRRPWATETQAQGPRGQALRTGLCVHMCPPVRDAARSGSPVTRARLPQLRSAPAHLVPGRRVPAVLPAQTGWGAGSQAAASWRPQGRGLGRGAKLFLCKHLFPQAWLGLRPLCT